MKKLEVTGSGKVTFSTVKELEKDNCIRISYLQHITDKGKKSSLKVIEFLDGVVLPLQKDLEVDFTGILRENIYKDKETEEFKSNGLEIIINELIIVEVFE